MSDRRWMVAAAAAVGLGLAAIPFMGTRAEEPAGVPGQAGKPAPANAVCDGKAKRAPDFALKDYSGKNVRLADYKGKVVFVNFWATWCGPCKYEIPMFVELQKKYGPQGLHFPRHLRRRSGRGAQAVRRRAPDQLPGPRRAGARGRPGRVRAADRRARHRRRGPRRRRSARATSACGRRTASSRTSRPALSRVVADSAAGTRHTKSWQSGDTPLTRRPTAHGV